MAGMWRLAGGVDTPYARKGKEHHTKSTAVTIARDNC